MTDHGFISADEMASVNEDYRDARKSMKAWKAKARARIAELESSLAALTQSHKELGEWAGKFIGLVSESRGVDGYHLNGDLAPWDEFEFVKEIQDYLAARPASIKTGEGA